MPKIIRAPRAAPPPACLPPHPPPTTAVATQTQRPENPVKAMQGKIMLDALSEFYGGKVTDLLERTPDPEMRDICLAALTDDDRAVFAEKQPHRTTGNGKYRGIFHCRLALLAMGQGAGISELPLDLGVWPPTIDRWRVEHPEFCGAIRLGERLGRAWWERVGRRNLWNETFNNVLYMMNMSNRYGWTRKVEGDISMRSEHTERRVLDLNVNVHNLDDRTLEHVARLLESGAAENAGA